MSMDMMNARVSTYFDLMAQIEQLQAEAEAIKDELKGQMMERETEELEGTGWCSMPMPTPEKQTLPQRPQTVDATNALYISPGVLENVSNIGGMCPCAYTGAVAGCTP